jgi:hypothetical protein
MFEWLSSAISSTVNYVTGKSSEPAEPEPDKDKYAQRRDNFYKILESSTDKPEALSNFLFASLDNNNPTLYNILPHKNYYKEAGKFAMSNFSALKGAYKDLGFYNEEMNTLNQVLNGRNPLDQNNPPFFLRLLNDPKTDDFLKKDNVASLMSFTTQGVISNLFDVKFDKNDLARLAELEPQINELSLIPASENDIKQRLEQMLLEKSRIEAKKSIAETIEILKEAGIDSANITSQLQPLVPAIFKEISKKPKEFRDLLYALTERSISPLDQKEKNLIPLLTAAAGIVPNILSSTSNNLISYIGENKDKIINAGAKIINSNKDLRARFESYGIKEEDTPKVIANALNIAPSALNTIDKATQKLLTPTLAPILAEAYNSYNEYQKLTKEINKILNPALLNEAKNIASTAAILETNDTKQPNADQLKALNEKKDQALSKLLDKSKGILSVAGASLSSEIQSFLKDNNYDITNLTTSLLKDNKVLKENGISDDLLSSLTNAGLNLASDLIPFSTKLAQEALSEEDSLTKVINNVQTTLKASNKDDDKHIDNLVESVFKLYNKPGIKAVIDKELPKLIEKHSPELGEVMDDFIKNTPIGKEMQIQGQEILSITSRKLPQLIEIAELFKAEKPSYSQLIPKAAKLLTDKEVFKVTAKAAWGYIKFKAKGKSAPVKLSDETKKALSSVNKNENNKSKPKKDTWIQKVAKMKSSSDKSIPS